MTREKAIEILRHYDDLVWQQENKVTMGMIADAIRMGEEALQSPWKSVKEELPKWDIKEEWGEGSNTVFFVDKMGDYYIGQYCIEHNEDGTDDTYWWDIEPDSGPVANVTHWFPIPELPKEKEDTE